MALYRAQVVFNTTSGITEDAVTNTLYFDANALADLDDVHAALEDFYGGFDQLYGDQLDETNCLVKYYQLSDPEPRSPVLEEPLTGLTFATNSGPGEVALVMSFQAAKISGLDQARRRGRIYIGPLSGAACGHLRPEAVVIALISDAGAALALASGLAAGWTWAQYSSVNGIGNSVVSGWVDNSWDTQRRRGLAPSQRTTFVDPNA